jgi:hypothetical protein
MVRHGLVPAVGKRAPARLQPFLKRQLAGVQTSFKRRITHRNQTPQEFIERVRGRIERINLPAAPSSWSGYHESGWLPFSPTDGWTDKHRTVHRVLSELRPSSVLDVASNEGWYSHLAAELGSSVVAFDVDEATATNLYRRNKGARLPILQLVMDVRNPSPGFGLCNLAYPPAIQRLSCEMVLALALIHHLVFKQHLHFEHIAQTLGAFSKKWLLLEFIPVEDQFVRLWSPEKYPWYNRDNLMAALMKYFRTIHVLPSAPEPRVLLLCEK